MIPGQQASPKNRIVSGGKKPTEITHDGADEGRLNDTEFALHECNDLQNRLSG
jgi:hypothetical protein